MTKPATRPQGRPKDPEKRLAIMRAAGHLFLDLGYERTSVDAIAAAAGVSKLTVYSHFEDKEGLFKALIAAKCEQYLEGRNWEGLVRLSPEAALRRLAQGIMGLVLNPDVLALYRVLMAQATQDPKTNALFYDTGPRATLSALAQLLAHWDSDGVLEVPDPASAADQLLSMLRGDLHLRALLNVEPKPSAQQVKRHANECIATFLRAYAPRKAARSSARRKT
jgi:TetR/AcrR family transcriptional repressor of mexJK operon